MKTSTRLVSVHCILLGLFALITVQPAFAEDTYLFDMGTVDSSVMPGYIRITKDTVIDEDSTYGWIESSGTGYESPDACFPYFIVHTHGTNGLLGDNVYFEGSFSATFRVKLSPGTYDCVVYLGCVGKYAAGSEEQKPIVDLALYVDGQEIMSGLDARRLGPKGKKMLDTNYWWGGYNRVPFVYEVSGGYQEVDIECRALGTTTSYPSFQAIEIRPFERYPLVYDHTIQELEWTAADPTNPVRDFVNAFNTHDYTSEELGTLAYAIQDPLTRACALLWAVGWLDGLEKDWNNILLDAAIDILQPMVLQHPAARNLLADAENFRHAAGHMTARSYTEEAVPDYNLAGESAEGRSIIDDNLGAAELLFGQLKGDMFDFEASIPIDNPFIETSPLYPRARFLHARTFYTCGTFAVPTGDPLKPNVADFWHPIINAFEPYIDIEDMGGGDFPKSLDLAVFFHMAQNYIEEKAIVMGWNHEPPSGVVTQGGYDYTQDAWWWPYVDIEDDHFAPAWANAQRRYRRGFKNAVEWWMLNRLREYPVPGEGYTKYELGGGDGDDQEGVGLFYYSEESILDAPDHVAEPLQGLMYNSLMHSDSVNREQGYFTTGEEGDGKAGDVEHTAEFTSYPLLKLITTDPPNYEDYIRFIEFLTTNALSGSVNDDIWTTDLHSKVSNGLQFRSFVFDDTDVILIEYEEFPNYKLLDYYDIPLNVKAILPTFLFLECEDAFSHSFWTDARDLVLALARNWREHTLDNQYSNPGAMEKKPGGIPPAAVYYLYVAIKYGWEENCSPSDCGWWNTAPAPDGNTAHYSDWSKGNGAGSAYTYDLLYQAYRHCDPADPERHTFLQPIVDAMKIMFDYRELGMPPKAFHPKDDSRMWAGTKMRPPICRSFFIARDAVIDEEDNLDWSDGGSGEYTLEDFDEVLRMHGEAYAKYMVQETTGTKVKQELETAFGYAHDWLKYYWILGTTGVAFTDRVWIMTEFSQHLLFDSITGLGTVLWSKAESDPDPLDMAYLVNATTKTSLDVLIYNFDPFERDLTFKIWKKLDKGYYRVELWKDANRNDVPDPGTKVNLGVFKFDKPMDGFTIDRFPANDGCLRILKIFK